MEPAEEKAGGARDRDKRDGRWMEVLLGEYGALKSEQLSRIGFRDNMLYTTIAAVGGLTALAFGVGNDGKPVDDALLLIPWVTTILGWTYVVNDEKITSIRNYVKGELSAKIERMLPPGESPFGWETYHNKGEWRTTRKGIQLVIDLTTFVLSGATALVLYFKRAKSPSEYATGSAILEGVFLFVLCVKICIYWGQGMARQTKSKAKTNVSSSSGDLGNSAA